MKTIDIAPIAQIVETPEEIQRRTECARIGEVIAELRHNLPPEAWQRVERVMRLTVSLYGAALGNALDHARAAGADPAALDARIAEDELLGKLLALEGKHPHTLQQRIEHTLGKLRTQLGLGDEELLPLAFTDGTLELGATEAIAGHEALICKALEDATPELTAIEIARIAPSLAA